MQATETALSVIREPITRKVITGEPVMGKLIRRVREGADGKGPVLRAPRRRPTSLGLTRSKVREHRSGRHRRMPCGRTRGPACDTPYDQ